MGKQRLYLGLACLAIAAGMGRLLADIEQNPWIAIDGPAIQYADRPVDDPVARLQSKLDSGKLKLRYEPADGLGYLPDLLKQLDINIDSQVLVFSKTSFQSPKISPRAPRALFFNDNVAVGSVQNGDVLELAALDPKQGVIFYTLDAQRGSKPTFYRRTDCLQCHQGLNTLGIPGVLVTSVFASADGTSAFRGSSLETDDRTPFEDRWGGWYVTGTGLARNMGNAIGHDPSHPRDLDYSGTQNLTSVANRFPASSYLAPTSDVVALMVLEHQTRMTNLMIRAGWEARAGHNELVDADVEALVSYMFFADEAKLYEPVEGVSTFTKTFPERGPKDKKGRSLRDFDLTTRIFKYPLSYMIYSEAFDNMPDAVREKIYRRVYDVLAGRDQSKTFSRLSPDDRKAIYEILGATKAGLPGYWKAEF